MTAKQLAALATAYSPNINEQAPFLDGILTHMGHLWHKAKEIPEAGKWILYEYDYEGEKAYDTVRIYPPHATKRWQVFTPHNADRWLYISDLITE